MREGARTTRAFVVGLGDDLALETQDLHASESSLVSYRETCAACDERASSRWTSSACEHALQRRVSETTWGSQFAALST